ncbi:MAG: hypothetical protein WC457_03950 [Patescibacteria group bacterium]
MSDRTKRILLIVALLTVTALLAFALYYFFKQAGPLAEVTPGEQGATTTGVGAGLPSAGGRATTTGEGGGATTTLPIAGNIPSASQSYYRTQAVTKIANVQTTYNSADKSGGMRYYNANDGKFYRVNADGTITAMSDTVFNNVSNVTWADGADKAVLEYPDGSNIVYNFETQKQVTLPKHWEDFSFSPDSTQIAAKSVGLSEENRWLVTTNDDGSGTQLLEALGENQDKVVVDWSPSRQAVAFAFTGDPLGTYRKEVLLVGLNGENFKSLTVEGMGFTSQWSPTGKKLLYSVYSPRTDLKPELWITNSYGNDIGSGRTSLEIETWPSKCTFAGDSTVYCGVPQTLSQGAGISPAIAAGTTDDLYKIDLTTGLKTKIATDGTYSISTISYDETNKRLLFTDANQSGVFEVSL